MAKTLIGNFKGPKGDKGDTGAQGPQGPQGPKGDTGYIDVDSELSTTSTNPVENKVVTTKINELNDSLSLLGNKKLNAIVQQITLSEKDCNTCKNGSYWHGYGQNYNVSETHLPINTNGFLISIGIAERANVGYTIQFFQPYPNPEKLYMRTMIFSWSEWKVITFN